MSSRARGGRARGGSGFRGRRDGPDGEPDRRYLPPRANRFRRSEDGMPSGTLDELLCSLENAPYGAYQRLEHSSFRCAFEKCVFTVTFDRIQRDPYAPASRLRVIVNDSWAGAYCGNDPTKVRAVCDFLARKFSAMLGKDVTGIQAPMGRGWNSSKGGKIGMLTPGQYVLTRNSVVVTDSQVELRVTLSLPAHGRSIEGRRCSEIIHRELLWLAQRAVDYSSSWTNEEKMELTDFVHCVEDQVWLRDQLASNHLVGFLPNGAILPRASGYSNRPLQVNPKLVGDDEDMERPEFAQPNSAGVVFRSPPSLQRQFILPHRGLIQGMGIPRGIVVITGGGFQGKSTLLHALESGPFDKVLGDGREYVVTVADALRIQSEEGRPVASVNIEGFLKSLPGGKSVTHFSSTNASGSTSQAAAMIEAWESGCRTLLLDEDTCATNLMCRDEVVAALIPDSAEPIRPLTQNIAALSRHCGVSFILVVGSSGAFFSVADVVIQMHEFAPFDVTEKARSLAPVLSLDELPIRAAQLALCMPPTRAIRKNTLRFGGKYKIGRKIVTTHSHTLNDDVVALDLSAQTQLSEPSQIKTIVDATSSLQSQQETISLCGLAHELSKQSSTQVGLDQISIQRYGHISGDYSCAR